MLNYMKDLLHGFTRNKGSGWSYSLSIVMEETRELKTSSLFEKNDAINLTLCAFLSKNLTDRIFAALN